MISFVYSRSVSALLIMRLTKNSRNRLEALEVLSK